MASSISSAEPEKLLRYSEFGVRLDWNLIQEANRLAATLLQFEASCTEPGFQVGVSHLGEALRSYGASSESDDLWVGLVGRGFQIADGMWRGLRFSPGRAAHAAWSLPALAWGAITLAALLPTIPAWLKRLRLSLPWLRDRSARKPETSRSPEQVAEVKRSGSREVSKEPSKAKPESKAENIQKSGFKPDVVSAGKPFSEVTVTATFPTYNNGYVHSGIDIQPKPFDRNRTYPVYPVGPGRVFNVGYEEGGYGNYIVIEHERTDGVKVYTRYAHLANPPALQIGNIVKRDTELGIMGATGNVTGPHLHLEVYLSPEPDIPPDGYGSHLATEQFPGDSKLTWGQKMQQNFVDPLPVINGTAGWQFKVPTE